MFTVARNSKSSIYEVHSDGCAHLNRPFMEVCVTGLQGESGEAVARQSANENEGCAYTTGPCVKARKSRAAAEVFWGEF